MTLLVVDTTGPVCAALVRRAGRDDVVASEAVSRGHDARVALVVDAALSQAGLAPGELTRVGTACGPGSFVGVRIGVAFARGLAAALGVPAVGVGVLDALAHAAAGEGLVAAVHDAKRGEVVWAAWRGARALTEPVREPVDVAEAGVAALAGGGSVRLAGTGAALLTAPNAVHTGLEHPPIRALADLAETADPATAPARTHYHRPPDAKAPGGVDPTSARGD